MRSCKSCGADLEGTHFNRQFCNPKCRYELYGPKAREATRNWRANNLDRALWLDLDKHLRRKFGISAEEYMLLLDEQDGRCKICLRTPEEVGDKGCPRLAVDHDHETGAVRGLLCRPCNAGLGHFQDSPELMASAINYLKVGQIWQRESA